MLKPIRHRHAGNLSSAPSVHVHYVWLEREAERRCQSKRNENKLGISVEGGDGLRLIENRTAPRRTDEKRKLPANFSWRSYR